MNDPSSDPTRQPEAGSSARASRAGIVAGLILATGVQLISILVALLWDNGVVDLEPNGPYVRAVQSLAMLALPLGPVGLVVALSAARVRSVLAWIVSLAVALPLLALLWFIGVGNLGGLAGEPF